MPQFSSTDVGQSTHKPKLGHNRAPCTEPKPITRSGYLRPRDPANQTIHREIQTLGRSYPQSPSDSAYIAPDLPKLASNRGCKKARRQ
uniref:Uncharacterized protein n=1 Tax=Arundo donax TaxID=35708 RepID=A0A0A9CBJ7_ARUDO